MKFQDYYQTLAVARDASQDEIKKAFRKLARKYHPDVSKEKDAELRMKEVNEAYAVLSDPEKRAAYDQLGKSYQPGQDFRPPPNWDEGFEFSGHDFRSRDAGEFSDFFDELFGHMGRGRKPRAGQGEFRTGGDDHHARIQIGLDEAWTGSTREIALRVPQLAEDGHVSLRTRKLQVRIPKGVQEGQLIRLAGQGSPGFGGGPPGDLYLEVSFVPQERYRVDRRDLYLNLPVAPWEAALGATIEVPLPAGERVKVRLPPGAQSGNQLRVRGMGLPAETAGDLFLQIEVLIPEAKDDAARALYQRMAQELAFDPRAAWRKT